MITFLQVYPQSIVFLVLILKSPTSSRLINTVVHSFKFHQKCAFLCIYIYITFVEIKSDKYSYSAVDASSLILTRFGDPIVDKVVNDRPIIVD